MKTHFPNQFRNITRGIIALCLVSLAFSACKKDETKKDQYFLVENMPSVLNLSSESKIQSYTVNSTSSWEVVAKGNDDWAKLDPSLSKGEGSGVFKIIISENMSQETRSTEFAFLVNGQQQPVTLKVTQGAPAIEPIFIVSEITTGKNITHTTQEVKISVESNINYSYSSDADWLVFDRKEENGAIDELVFKASANDGSVGRPARIEFTVPDFPELSGTFIIAQDGKPSAAQIFKEDFNWLTTGNPVFYTTTGERRMDTWTEAELATGWTSTPHPESANQFLVYARPGFVKLGKTSFSGDLITPELSAIVGTQNLMVKFKAVPYKTAGGAQDGNILRINIIGPGTISNGEFIIDNWPVYGSDAATESAAIWRAAGTERTFTITGATNKTKIRFVGDDLIPAKTNRIFLDDIEVITIVD